MDFLLLFLRQFPPIRKREIAEALGNYAFDLGDRFQQSLCQVIGMGLRLVNNNAAIHHEENPPGRVVGSTGEGEHRDVDARGLPGGGGQGNRVRPVAVANAIRQTVLPRERLVAVNGLIELRELVRGGQAHECFSFKSGRQAP